MKNSNICIICKINPIKIKKRKLCTSCYRKYKDDVNDYLCTRCGKKGVEVKKYKLCLPCYQKMNRDKKNKITISGMESEIYFLQSFFAGNSEWIYHPALFRLPDGKKYTPDFYDISRHCFIEVVGSRQAYYANKTKYDTIRKTYPEIKLEVRMASGHLFEDNSGETGVSMSVCLNNMT